MPNVLNGSSPEGVPPPLPQEAAGAPAQGQAAPGANPGMPPQQAPQLTHAQAVAALRHFSAISRQLEILLKDPDLGKADVKSKVIDGTTKLVASRIITPGQAVQQLTSVPADPLMQRKWVQSHFEQSMLAMNAVLDHHAQAEPGTGDPAQEIARSTSNPDAHMDDMGAIHSHYRQGRQNG